MKMRNGSCACMRSVAPRRTGPTEEDSMAITIGPNTGENHIGFTHDDRTFIIDHSLGPELKRLTVAAAPDPALIDEATFVSGDTRLHVTGVEPAAGGAFTAYVDGIPSELTLTATELATLASVLPG